MLTNRLYGVVGYLMMACLLTACGRTTSRGTYVWIEVPVDGLHVLPGASVQVEGHAGHAEGIEQIEVWINGELDGVVESPPYADGLAHFIYHFMPESSGEHLIQAVAFGPDRDPSNPDSTRIFVSEEPTSRPDLAITRVEAFVVDELDSVPICTTQLELTNAGETAVDSDFEVRFQMDGSVEAPSILGGGLASGAAVEITSTTTFSETHEIVVLLDASNQIEELDEDNNEVTVLLTCGEVSPLEGPTPTPEADITGRFWAEPAEITAGTCTKLFWDFSNVSSIIFGGIEQELQGEYRACLCEDERYTLSVTHLDGSLEKIPVDISVTGVCATPTVVDSTPPPAPAPQVPANGLTLSCRSYQDLTWLPVSDPSGISEYQVQVERHSGDSQWAAIPGSTFTGIGGKTLNISVECGWYYRWRVRAIDGADNTGSWSSWSSFIDSLG